MLITVWQYCVLGTYIAHTVCYVPIASNVWGTQKLLAFSENITTFSRSPLPYKEYLQ